ncbi:hypothetical protein QVD17_16101 [Tagetes erecta]|uniref:Uncharacterized protein n=1 Tax=Tagetes erecta TaxID=13708 RepID=A0AAD8KUI0_TARER|nr:hypothetical protein QVD17_16101 [Tagetes erecta]
MVVLRLSDGLIPKQRRERNQILLFVLTPSLMAFSLDHILKQVYVNNFCIVWEVLGSSSERANIRCYKEVHI